MFVVVSRQRGANRTEKNMTEPKRKEQSQAMRGQTGIHLDMQKERDEYQKKKLSLLSFSFFFSAGWHEMRGELQVRLWMGSGATSLRP